MTIKEIEEIMTPEEKQVYELALDYGLFDSLPEILEKVERRHERDTGRHKNSD